MTKMNRLTTLALLATVLLSATGCSTHCSCPPAPQQPAPTTIIHEEPRDQY